MRPIWHSLMRKQLETIRTSVSKNTTMVTNMSSVRATRLPRRRSNLRGWQRPQLRTIWPNMTNNMTMMTNGGKLSIFIQPRRSFRHRFRNFSVNIRLFTFFYPSNINLQLFIIPFKWGNIKIFSFKLGSTTSLTLVNILTLILNSTSCSSKLLILSTWDKI